MGNNESGLSPRELSDLEGVTAFSQTEIKDWYKQFHKGCPSGTMTKDQFRAMYEEAFKTGDASQFADCVFSTYDKDGNGTIDFREFLLSTNLSARGSIDEKLRWLFHMYDLDDNGYVTRKEVTQMCKAILAMRGDDDAVVAVAPDRLARAVFSTLDLDGDKRINEFEFILGAKGSPHILAILDKNQLPGPDAK